MKDDTISRRAAIDATWFEPSYTDPLNVLTEVRDRLKALPPAQPEIIRCRECEYWDPVPASSASPEFHVCNGFLGAKIAMRAQDFCSRALRKEAADE